MATAERTAGLAATEPVQIQRAALIVNTRARRAAASFARARALLTGPARVPHHGAPGGRGQGCLAPRAMIGPGASQRRAWQGICGTA